MGPYQEIIHFSIVQFIMSKLAVGDGDVLEPHASAFCFLWNMTLVDLLKVW